MKVPSGVSVPLTVAFSAILCAGAEVRADPVAPDSAAPSVSAPASPSAGAGALPPLAPRIAPRLEERPYRSLRFRGGPKEVCGSFLLTEFSWMWRLGGTGPISRNERVYWSLDLGWARNVGSSSAVGATAYLGGDSEREHLGVRARFRQWLARNVSLDVAPGVILAGEEENDGTLLVPGFATQTSVMVDDRVGVVGQVFVSRRRFTHPVVTATGPLGPVYETRTDEASETGWCAGLRLGSGPGVAATALLLALGMFWLIPHGVAIR